MAKIDNSVRVNPMRLTDTETGDVYTLEFSCDSVRFAGQRGFKFTELSDFPQMNIPAFFFYAFRKNHRDVARDKTDKLLEAMGGLTPAELSRIMELYNQPNEALIITDEGGRKNARVTVEL